MRPDPFRIQLLTLTLDSQAVLTVVGLLAAALVFRLAARREGLDLRAGHWLDLVTASLIGARLLWVATHVEYYLRQPPQILVIIDGGLHPLGLVLGAAYWIWRFVGSSQNMPWRALVDIVAIGALTTFLFERAGCALTTCGAGPQTELPWALYRGAELREPLALEQLIVIGATLALSVEFGRVRGAAFGMAWLAFGLVEYIGLVAGSSSLQGFVAIGAALVLYAMVTVWGMQTPRLRPSPPPTSPAG